MLVSICFEFFKSIRANCTIASMFRFIVDYVDSEPNWDSHSNELIFPRIGCCSYLNKFHFILTAGMVYVVNGEW